MLDEETSSRVELRSAKDRIRGAFAVGIMFAIVGGAVAGGFWSSQPWLAVVGLILAGAGVIPFNVAVIAWGVRLGMSAFQEENAEHA